MFIWHPEWAKTGSTSRFVANGAESLEASFFEAPATDVYGAPQGALGRLFTPDEGQTSLRRIAQPQALLSVLQDHCRPEGDAAKVAAVNTNPEARCKANHPLIPTGGEIG